MTTAERVLDSSVPEAAEAAPEARILDHEYDGIREYDNPLPGWWSSIFIGSIVFAGFYALYFHVVGWGASPQDNYQAALASYDSKRDVRERAELANINEAYLVQQVADYKVLERGNKVFAERCASCHGAAANGLIGPNLTDDYQRNGSTRLDIYRTVRGGVPGTAMLAWGDQMAPADVVAATSFVITLRGTNVRGRPPEGVPVGPFAK